MLTLLRMILKASILFYFILLQPFSFASEIEDKTSNLAVCQEQLVSSPTHKGNLPKDFFAHTHKEGRPRLVLTAGISGSGKSSWTKVAEKQGWVILSPDEMRREIVEELKAKNQNIELEDGTIEPADPSNQSHLFRSKNMRALAHGRAVEKFKELAIKGKSVVVDALNISPKRVSWVYRGREAGYFIEALVFKSKNIQDNFSNIDLRQSQGGQDLSRGMPNRKDFMDRMLRNMEHHFEQFPITAVQEITGHFTNAEHFPNGIDLETIPFELKDLASYLESLSPEAAEALKSVLRLDVYNNIEFIEVKRWSDTKTR